VVRRLLACSLALSVLSGAPFAFAADVKITDAARKHFNAGVALLKDPDGARYEEAYREFKVAYAASPSWKILGNLGLAAMKLERDGEAIAAFEQYLAEGKKDLDASERADVERDLSTLRASAVELNITTTPGDAAVTDERSPVQGAPVRNRYQASGGTLKLLVRPGHHRLTSSIDGKPALTWELEAESGSSHQHTFDFNATAEPAPARQPDPSVSAPAQPESASPASRPTPTGVYVGLVATGVFAVGAGVTGVLALGKSSDYEKANGQNAAEAQDLHDSTKTLNLVTDVLIGAALVSAGVTTYLYLKRPEQEPAAAGVRLRLRPQVGIGTTGLSLLGAF